MGRIDELVSAEFAAWEQRGRGWQVWPEPVRPEPPFQEFRGYRLTQSQFGADDGRRPSLLASLFDSFERRINPKPPIQQEESVKPEPVVSQRPLTAEFVASLPASLNISDDILGAFLDSLHACAEPTGFELFGNHEAITLQFASSANDAPTLQRQLDAFFPKFAFTPTQETLAGAWNGNDGVGFIVDFGLAHEFMLPLQTRHSVDPFVGIVAALNELQRDEVAVFQVLFQPTQNPWPKSVWRSITDRDGKAIFLDQPHLMPGTKEKLELPLFGVAVRAAAKAATLDRAATVVRDIAYGLGAFTRLERNNLIPLRNDEYITFETHEADLTFRQSRRGGMLLNRDELRGFVHLPSDQVRSSKLRRQRVPTKAAPSTVLSTSGLLLGNNLHAGRMTPVFLSAEQRVRHMHVIGASGTGKSTLLFNLIRQDIESGQGVGLLDPHGDLVERILGIIPPARIEDVVVVDLSDEDFFIGFNILSAHSDFEKTLLASDLVSVFRRLSESWGDQMGSVLNNTILAFLESDRGGTLADLRRFLLEPGFRTEFLTTVRDLEVLYYWRTVFPQLAGNKSVGPILTRLDAFLGRKAIRYMVSQPVNRLDFAHILDTGKIFLAKLPQGQIGQENAFLLGSLLVSKFQQLAMSRQRMSEAERKNFWLYIDEFHNFITPSMAEILSGARKYRLGLVLAHQELRQLQRDSEVAGAVMNNPSIRVVFRVGDDDARKLSEGFATFEARDLQNLGTGEAIARVERSDFDFNLTIPNPAPADPVREADTRRAIIAASRRKYATPRAEVEAALAASARSEHAQSPQTPKAPRVPPSARMSSEAPPTLQPPEAQKPADSEQEHRAAQSPESPTVVPTPASQQETAAAQPSDATSADAEASDNFHDDAKKQITDAATGFDYTVTPEQWVLQGSARVDLVLERGSRKIACEVCATSTAAQEVAHITARLQAGFTDLAVVCRSHLRLSRIQQKIASEFPPDQADRVGYYHLAEFISQLREWARQDPAGGEVQRAKQQKRNIDLGGSRPSDEERQRQEKVWLEEIARNMENPPQQN